MTLGRVLERSAERYPEKTAIIFGNRQVTYKELNTDANRLARVLNKLGIDKDDKVGLLMPNCPEYLVGVFAALKTGAAFVPINTSLQGYELVHIIEHSDAKAIITAPPYDELLVLLRSKMSQGKHILTIAHNPKDEDLIAIPGLMGSYDDTNLAPVAESEDVAAIYYTSGTTDLPKGVMLTHSNIVTNIASIGQAVKAKHKDILLTCLPLSNVFAMTTSGLLPVFGGMTNVLLEEFLPHPVLKGISDWKVTFFFGMPAMYAALAEMPQLEKYAVSQLRIGVCCEAPLTQTVIDKFESRFPCKLYEEYGLAECSPVVSINPVVQRKIGSLGKPLDEHIKWRIVDHDGNPVPRNTIGELIVSGSNVMKGYYQDKEATQQTIQDEWLYTSDMAYMDESGFVFLVDRKQNLMTVAGEAVYPKEIEDVLQQHPAVQDAGVIGVADPNQGEVPKAYIVPVSGSSVNEHALLAFCRERLAPHQVPQALEVIDFMPRNASGKMLRRVLRRITAGLPEEEEAFYEDLEPEETPETEKILDISFIVSFDELLHRLVTEIPGGIAGSIFGIDGVGLASFATAPDFPTIVADAEFAAVMSECRGSAETLEFGDPHQACLLTERYGVLMQQIGQYVITLVTDPGATDWEATQTHFDQLVPLIAKGLL